MENNDTFPAFQSIPRLRRSCVISEKLDGTNALISISDDGAIRAGSRNRWITPDDDNFGFARWVSEHPELAQLGPGLHYGEWWGSGIQRRYGLSEKRFSLFNAGRWGAGGPDADKLPACCHVVPVLYTGNFDDRAVDEALAKLANGSVAAPGFAKPEGIVIWLSASRSLFKYTLDGDGHKTKK
jgi:hypothetical protein